MNNEKIGRFIAQKRKENNLTQAQLAEKLFLSDRAISKWERGKSMPDAAIMNDLCGILGITLSELFAGEELSKKRAARSPRGATIGFEKGPRRMRQNPASGGMAHHDPCACHLLSRDPHQRFLYGIPSRFLALGDRNHGRLVALDFDRGLRRFADRTESRFLCLPEVRP